MSLRFDQLPEPILVVEAHVSLLSLMADTLQTAGYEVETATDGRAALKRLESGHSFALVISDLSLPQASGLDVLAAAKKHHPSIEVILITAPASVESAIEALRQGAYDYLTTPFDLDDYKHRVQRALDYRRLKLERELLLFKLQQQADTRKTLVEAGQAVNRTLSFQKTLTTTLTIAQNLTGASAGRIVLYTPNRTRIDSVITLNNSNPLTGEDRRRVADLSWQAMTNRETQWLAYEAGTAEQTSPSPLFSKEDEGPTIKTWLAIPLTTNEAPFGVLALGSYQTGAFTSEQVNLVQVMVDQATTAIENAYLYEEVERRLTQTEALAAISQHISTTLDLPQVLQLIVDYAVKTILAATYSSLYLVDPTHQTPQLEARTPSDHQAPPEAIESVRLQAIGQAINDLKPVHIVWRDEALNGQAAWTILIAPLRSGEKAIGAVSVESPTPDSFVPSDETLLTTFASYASVAIQNANLFQDLSVAYADLHQHQHRVLQSNRTLQVLFDGITDGLYIVNNRLEIVAINQAEAERLEQSPRTLLGQVCDASIWGEAAPILTEIVRRTFATGKKGNWESAPWTDEQTTASERGPFTNRDVRIYPIFTGAGAVNQVIIFAQDVSEKRHLQASLYNSAQFASIGQLASSIAHEINNPLTVIIANTQVMSMEVETSSPDYPIINQMLEAGLRIQHIIQNLLDFSTQDSYEWFETDVTATIHDALSLVAVPLRRSKIAVITEIDDLPLIMASANHLKLLWMNLLINARDAIDATQQAGEVTIRGRRQTGDRLCFEIIDNGVGLPNEDPDHLFHPFFTTKPPGTSPGLGLYICRVIMQHHQGTIHLVNNQKSQGVTAILTFPTEMTIEESTMIG